MEKSKLIKIFPAFKVSPEMHEAVGRLAQKNNRKLTDQVRYLIEQGLAIEEGTDVASRVNSLEHEIHSIREELAGYAIQAKGPRRRAAS